MCCVILGAPVAWVAWPQLGRSAPPDRLGPRRTVATGMASRLQARAQAWGARVGLLAAGQWPHMQGMAWPMAGAPWVDKRHVP